MHVPNRADVLEQWTSLIAGTTTRQDVHHWAMQWVELSATEIPDPLTKKALQYLHGFDMAYDSKNHIGHDISLKWVYSKQDIADILTRWQAECLEYDQDPVDFKRRARQRALEEITREKEK
jgi:hypothetical protein